MRIETELTFKEYLNVVCIVYRKPIAILLSILGLVMFIGAIIYFFADTAPVKEPTYFAIFFGLITVITLPLSAYFGARRNFYSDAVLQDPIIYEFEDDKIRVVGKTFTSDVSWNRVYKILELKQWILIYHSKSIAYIIPKQSFQEIQLTEFRALIKSNGVSAKLK